MDNQYDEQIKRLTEHPEQMCIEWGSAKGLFKMIGRDSFEATAGCLTMIRSQSRYKALINGKVDDKLTEEIRNDDRIPMNWAGITVAHLPVFKEWQERIDKLQTSHLS